MASFLYNSFKADILKGNIAMVSATIKLMLVTSAYTADKDAHTFRSSVTNEVSGTGYSAGGATLSTKSVTQDNTGDQGVFDADDVTWATSTITARAAVMYKSTGSAATDNLIAYIDFGSDKSSAGGDFVIQWSASGIIAFA